MEGGLGGPDPPFLFSFFHFPCPGNSFVFVLLPFLPARTVENERRRAVERGRFLVGFVFRQRRERESVRGERA